jgi:adenine-specific DNA-methyltransferase
MPTLHWIGKDKVINHHLDVPFKVLEHAYGFENGSTTKEKTQTGNKIIHGDNLEALKALLPKYEGKIKCIYIDPPYNTGNEGWIYNDNVNDPKIKKWLQSVVGKEGEDLSRHDKWLCMMYPRLKLLHKLLAEDGAIFISIDDNEQANLRLLCDEIFGGGNFLGNICWQKKQSPQNDAINFSDMHDFIVMYSKRKKSNRNDTFGFNRNLIPKTDEQNARYKNPDNDERGNWASGDCSSNKTRFERPNLYYPVIHPLTNDEIYPSESRVWRFEKNTFDKLISENRIYFGKDGKSFPRLKLFLEDVADGVVPSTWWSRDFAGDNQVGRRTLREIFRDVESDFSTPKPTSLIERILQISTNKNDIILDSFAGSGTTAHAVLNLNKEDEGNRQFILIEMENYAENITAERVKRVINGYGNTEGTGGGFDFYELGQAIFLEDGNLNEAVGVERIREYVYYTETKHSLNAPEEGIDSVYFLGKYNDTSYYFNYEPDHLTTLDHDFLATIKTPAEQYVIYADNCLLTQEFRIKYHIIFKKIPRDITRF